MNGREMFDIRQRLGLTRLELAREIGYTGTDRNDTTLIRRYENGQKQIPLYIARLLWLMGEVLESAGKELPIWPDELAREERTAVQWPEWPGYEFEHTPDEEIASTNG